MKSPVLLALGLTLSISLPSTVLAGGKSSDKHVQARAAKVDADVAAEKKAEAKAEADKAGLKPTEEEKAWVWNHRAVRHKQTMPAAPTRSDSAGK